MYLKPIYGIGDIEEYRKKESTKSSLKAEVKKCPKCNREMVIKCGRYGQFWG